MNRRDAALQLALRYPGGVDAVAARMGKRGDTVRKELTGCNGYKWGTDDEELLMCLCLAAGVRDALAPLTASAANHGALLLPMPMGQGEQGEESLRALAETAREFSEFIATVAEAEADGRVTANELRRSEREAGELVASLQRQLARLRQAHESGKPGHLKAVGE